MQRLLLLSTSTVHGTGYLEHGAEALKTRLAGVSTVCFIPFALKDHNAYAAKARAAFEAMGFWLDSLHEAADPVKAVESAEAVFCGGGNTFRLLETLYRLGVMAPLRARALAGMPYTGASAGSNLACPTIRTTNDMPIVEPPTFEALGLLPCQINPHYLDPDPASTHMGETREERLRQFHEENATPVVGLREGAMLRVDDDTITLLGLKGARLFRRGMDPVEVAPGTELGEFLG
ncbi:MAG TPA: dipeptidase PepE [Holophagaceae bacterium]|nr:dipeptidase PepE [Holophagaceae bacterium]